MSTNIDRLLQQFQTLPADQQIQVAEVIDRLTWAKRWSAVCERITSSAKATPLPGDEQIDEMVRAVRREKPLSARSLTPPS